MSVKITVGWLKKIGQPEFGSLGANCNVEFEADHALLSKGFKGFHQRVQNIFAACRQAVEEELARQSLAGGAGKDPLKALVAELEAVVPEPSLNFQ